MDQLVKNLHAMREIWVQSLGWENPLEKGKAAHSSILAWIIPWTTQSMGLLIRKVVWELLQKTSKACSLMCNRSERAQRMLDHMAEERQYKSDLASLI